MSAPAGTPVLARAVELAVLAHEGQRRKGGSVPYAVHPLRVMARVHAWGIQDPEVLAAAALHDVVEDTDVTQERVELEFGARVAELVECLTHESGLPPRERTRVIVAQLEEAPLEAVVVKLADRLDNVLEMPAWRAGSRVGYLAEAGEIAKVASARLAAMNGDEETKAALRAALGDYEPVIARLAADAERDLSAERGARR